MQSFISINRELQSMLKAWSNWRFQNVPKQYQNKQWRGNRPSSHQIQCMRNNYRNNCSYENQSRYWENDRANSHQIEQFRKDDRENGEHDSQVKKQRFGVPRSENGKYRNKGWKTHLQHTFNHAEFSSQNSYPKQNNCPRKQTPEVTVEADERHEDIEKGQSIQKKGEEIQKAIVNATIPYLEVQGLPIIPVSVNNLGFYALIDSGATISLLSNRAYEEIKSEAAIEKISNYCEIRTVTGEIIQAHKCVSISLKIQNTVCRNAFFVTDQPLNTKYSMILGWDFFNKHKVVLNMETGTLKVKDKEVEFQTPPTFYDASDGQKTLTISNIKLLRKISIQPGETIQAEVQEPLNNNQQSVIQFTPKTHTKVKIQGSGLVAQEESKIQEEARKGARIQIENHSNSKVHLNKSMTVGTIIGQMNSNSNTEKNFSEEQQALQAIRELRRKEFRLSDFDISHIPPRMQKTFSELLNSYAHVFSKSYATLGYTTRCQPEINLQHNYSLSAKPYSIPFKLREIAKKEIDEMLQHGIIERSSGPYAFPILLVKKPLKSKDGLDRFRVAIDYRLLNENTLLTPFQSPKIKDILATIGGFKYYSSLDLKSAFFQQLLRPQDRDKCSFITSWGQFRPRRQMFGLKNSGICFSKLMVEVLEGLEQENIKFYMDDLIVAANSPEEMIRLLKLLFQRLADFNLTLDPSKVHLCKEEITFVGFKISAQGTQPSEDNAKKIHLIPPPTSKKHVQSFLGLCNYFRFLIPKYAEIIAPLTHLTKPSVKFTWSEECKTAFKTLQKALTSHPVVAAPDFTKKFLLNTDASGKAISAILLQEKDGVKHIIANYSRILSPAERRYPAVKAELLAIRDAIYHFREYLRGTKFTLISDAKSLKYNLNLDRQSDIVARWLLEIKSYEFDFSFISGSQNPSDFLSREVNPNPKQVETIATLSSQLKCPTNEQILCHQLQDPEISKIISLLQIPNMKTPSNLKKYSLGEHGILKLQFRKKRKIFIPLSLRREMIQWAHSTHMGKHKTTGEIVKFFYWPKLHRDVANYVTSCHQCLTYKKHNIPNAIPIKADRPKFPGEVIQIDIMGKYVRTNSGNSYILSIIDQFSRFAQFTPIKNIMASTVITHLQRFFAAFGVPRKIITDQGTQFTSTSFKHLLHTWNVRHAVCSVAHPKSNSIVERSHGTLKDRIAALTQGTFDWDKEIDLVTQWYNSSEHSQTGYSPAELFLMRKITNPMYPEEQRKVFPCYSKFVEDQEKENKKIQKKTLEIQNKCQDLQVSKSKNVRTRKFEVGTRVYLKNWIPDRALGSKFSGPYLVTEVNNNNNVTIQLEGDDQAKTMKLNIDKLIIASERLPHLQEPKRPETPPQRTTQEDGPAFNLRPSDDQNPPNYVTNMNYVTNVQYSKMPASNIMPEGILQVRDTLSSAQFAKEQRKCKSTHDIIAIIERLKQEEKYKDFIIDSRGVLLKQCREGMRICVPNSLRQLLLEEAFAHHREFSKMRSLIAKSFHWKTLTADLRSFLARNKEEMGTRPLNCQELFSKCASVAEREARTKKLQFKPTSKEYESARQKTWEKHVPTTDPEKLRFHLPVSQVVYPFYPIQNLPLHKGLFQVATSTEKHSIPGIYGWKENAQPKRAPGLFTHVEGW